MANTSEAHELYKVTASQVAGGYTLSDQFGVYATFSNDNSGFRLLNACIAHLEETGVEVDNRT